METVARVVVGDGECSGDGGDGESSGERGVWLERRQQVEAGGREGGEAARGYM